MIHILLLPSSKQSFSLFIPHNRPFIPHVPFDYIQNDQVFQRVPKSQQQQQQKLAEMGELLLKRANDLTPTSTELNELSALVGRAQAVLDQLQLSPGDFDACVRYHSFSSCFCCALFGYSILLFQQQQQQKQQLDEIKQVGSFKKSTILAPTRCLTLSGNKLVADMCVVLKTLPTSKCVRILLKKIESI